MNSPYDKLGDLLKEAINQGEIPSKNKKNNNIDEKEGKKNSEFVYKSIQPYNLFNTTPGIPFVEIKKIYHNLLKKYHPDNIKNFPNMQKIATQKTNDLIKAFNEITEDYKRNQKIENE